MASPDSSQLRVAADSDRSLDTVNNTPSQQSHDAPVSKLTTTTVKAIKVGSPSVASSNIQVRQQVATLSKAKQSILRSTLRNIGLSSSWRSYRSWRSRRHSRATTEPRKVIVDSGLRMAMSRCLIHGPPLAMTIILASLHIHGFYIGDVLEGSHVKYMDTLKVLGIQVAAKIIELLMVASLATVVVDLVRALILSTETGLPFGLAIAHLSFGELKYFWSSEFYYGIRGIGRKRTAIPFSMFLVVCGLIALLSGPATALLLMPTLGSNWKAGGTDFYIAGNLSTNYPVNLTLEHIGPGPCRDQNWQQQLISDSGCIWAGYLSLLQSYREAHQTHVVNLTLADGLNARLLQRYILQTPEPYTIAPHAASSVLSNNFGQYWIPAIQAIHGVGSYAHYKRLFTPHSFFYVDSYIPVVRTACKQYINFTVLEDYWQYPYFPDRGPWSGPIGSGTTYHLPPLPLINSSMPTASWRHFDTSQELLLSNGITTTDKPSAFITLQIPHDGKFEPFGALMTCSIDARWVYSTNVGMNFDSEVPGKFYSYGMIPPNGQGMPATSVEDAKFPWTRDRRPEYGSLAMTPDWLNNLTPIIDTSTPNYTSVASIFHAMLVDNAFTDLGVEFRHKEIESVVATVVADGLSRVGFGENGGNVTLSTSQGIVVARYNTPMGPGSQWAKNIYKGTASLPFVPGYDASNSTALRWDVTIAGYFYLANDVTHWLALSLLFCHAVIAFVHISWKLWHRRSSDAWESLSELIALAQNSPPADELKNTCGGIDAGAKYRMPVRIGVVVSVQDPSSGKGEEEVQMLFGSSWKSHVTVGSVVTDRAYGSS